MLPDRSAEDLEESDGTLVGRARGGDFGAFEELVTRHERRLYALALSIVRRSEDAEDVVQSAFLSALEHLAAYREEASFATWITRIATNAALKVLRKRRGLTVFSLDRGTGEDGDDDGEVPHPEFIADWRGDPAKLVERRELRRILDEAIDALPEKQRLVFVLRDVAGMNVEETAGALGLSAANVRVRHLRARLLLRERLTRAFGDEARRLERPAHHDAAGRRTVPPGREAGIDDGVRR